jgi:hypothetical protein
MTRMFEKYKYDLMISYQWSHQKTCLAIKQSLEKLGYRVWMDTEKMVGDLNDRMAEAVDKSHIILICMSKKYEESQNCKKVRERKMSDFDVVWAVFIQ